MDSLRRDPARIVLVSGISMSLGPLEGIIIRGCNHLLGTTGAGSIIVALMNLQSATSFVGCLRVMGCTPSNAREMRRKRVSRHTGVLWITLIPLVARGIFRWKDIFRVWFLNEDSRRALECISVLVMKLGWKRVHGIRLG